MEKNKLIPNQKALYATTGTRALETANFIDNMHDLIKSGEYSFKELKIRLAYMQHELNERKEMTRQYIAETVVAKVNSDKVKNIQSKDFDVIDW